MISSTEGIVFRSMKYGETSMILDVYTKDYGLKSYIIGGVRKRKSTTGASLTQVMNIADIVAYHKDGQVLNRIKEMKSHIPYRLIPYDIVRSSIGVFMIEICRKSIREYESNEPLYDFVKSNFLALDSQEQKLSDFHIKFMLQLSSYLGFGPSEQWSEANSQFNIQDGVFQSKHLSSNYLLDQETSYILNQYLHHEVDGIKVNKKQKNALLSGLIKFFELHVENFGTLKSLTILQQVMT